jgi:hypothetical protein
VRVHPEGADFVWGALTLSRGWLYVPVASLCDVGHYNGGVTEISLSRPSRVRHWFTTGGTHAYAGGIWGWAGLSVDPHSGDLYAASGNSIGTASEAAGAAEAVIALSPRLSLLQENHPLHPPYEIGDRDSGTTPVLIHRAGCPAQLVAINKDGELFVYNRAHSSAGPVQRHRHPRAGQSDHTSGRPSPCGRTGLQADVRLRVHAQMAGEVRLPGRR